MPTPAAIAPGRWLRTGDIGHLEERELYGNSRRRDLILRGAENVYPVEIERWCAERLAYFQVPAHWELRREALPRTATGKVLEHLQSGDGPSPFVEE